MHVGNLVNNLRADANTARRELGEVREAATVALAALRRYESAEGYKQDWHGRQIQARLAAALGKEQGNEH